MTTKPLPDIQIHAVKILQESGQFRINRDHISQEIYYHFDDPLEELSTMNKENLHIKLEHLAHAAQIMLDNEYVEVNGQPVQRYVVDLIIRYPNYNQQHPVLCVSIESQKYQLLPNKLNRLILRRQEEIKDYDVTESWVAPGIIQRAARVNLIRPLNDASVTETICGSRVDFENGKTRICGGTDIIEFLYSENWEEIKEICLETSPYGLLSRLGRKNK
ncbi:MAG: hypothetical protein ACFFBD_02900 [Candidatus Hodarchaeota archaeon]